MDRSLPSDIDSERFTLGALLLQPTTAIQEIAGWLKPEHFYLEKHAWIYEAMLAIAMRSEPTDVGLVTDELRRANRLEPIGGLLYLIDLANQVPFPSHIAFYARIVHRTALQRLLITAGGQIAALAFDERGELEPLLTAAQEKLHEVTKRHIGAAKYTPQTLTSLLKEPEQPVKWAVPDLLPAGLTLLCGKPKMKKSWLALSLGIAIASGGRALGHLPVEQGEVLYLCLEDGRRRLRSRATKILMGGGSLDSFYFVTDWPKVDDGGLRMLESWLQQHPATRLVVIDTLQKVRPARRANGGYDDDYKALEDLQRLAVAADVPFLVVHHLNKRDVSDEADSISGTTGLTGACDGWLILKRDRRANEGTLSINGRDIEEEREIAVRWDGPTCQWVSEGDAEAYHISQQRADILSCLQEAGQPLGPKDVADELGMEHANTRQLMRRMARDGELTIESRGRYTVAPTWVVPPESDSVIDIGTPESDKVIDVIMCESADHFERSLSAPLAKAVNGQSDRSDHICTNGAGCETCANVITSITLVNSGHQDALHESDRSANGQDHIDHFVTSPTLVVPARHNINQLRAAAIDRLTREGRHERRDLNRLSLDALRRLEQGP